MRSHRPSPEHQEAVSRRLALLSAELTAVRESDGLGGDVPVDGWPEGRSVDPWAPPATHTRVRADRWEEGAAAPTPAVVLPDVPLPGRHAHRRAGARLGDLVPDSWRGRLALGPGQFALVTVAVVVGVAVTGWWLVRGSPTEVVAPGEGDLTPVLAAPLVSGPASAPQPSAPSGQATTDLVVDVAGKVRRPGIAVLDPGSRVVDALEAAGGAHRGVDLSSLNLARQLVDGEQILVGLAPATGAAAGLVAGTPQPGASGALVSINAADQTLLESLPEVGPVTAQAIIAWRDEHGGFTAVDELLEVDGIGETTLGRLAPLVTL